MAYKLVVVILILTPNQKVNKMRRTFLATLLCLFATTAFAVPVECKDCCKNKAKCTQGSCGCNEDCLCRADGKCTCKGGKDCKCCKCDEDCLCRKDGKCQCMMKEDGKCDCLSQKAEKSCTSKGCNKKCSRRFIFRRCFRCR